METNIDKIKLYSKKIEKTFQQLNINFENLELMDDDINYRISFRTSDAFLLSIKSLNVIDALVYINSQDYSLNFMSVNIYQIDSKNNIKKYYEILNDVNAIINHGKFTLHKGPLEDKDSYRIIYRSVVDYAENYDIFSAELLKSIIKDFLKNLSIFYIILKTGVDNNE